MQGNPLLEGLPLAREPAPFTLFIFGASGDLTNRKLLPALFSLFDRGYVNDFRVAGFARRNWTEAEFRQRVAELIQGNEDMKAEFLRRISYIAATFESPQGYRRIAEGFRDPRGKLFYLATPPGEYETIIDNLGRAGLAAGGEANTNAASRIVIEKPFGRDLQSARALNRRLAAVFREEQIYRIDHYLGKETVQNVLILRYGNGVFEPVWNNRYVQHVQITMAETLGVQTRGSYYEQAGALRDIVQNHLLQLLCLVAMEPPNDLHPDSIRNEKVKVLKAIKPIAPERVAIDTVRGQYGRGIIEGLEVPAYREEPGVDPASDVETFAALRLYLNSWRWAGVPFFLRTGKRLARRATEIVIQFRLSPHLLFEGLDLSPYSANSLVLRIQPDEGVMLTFNAKIPGFATQMRPVNMDFSYGASFGEEPPEAYERLLLDAFLGDATLYIRSDEAEAAWAYIDGVRQAWAENGSSLCSYPAGSSGPEETRRLIADTGRWRKL